MNINHYVSGWILIPLLRQLFLFEILDYKTPTRTVLIKLLSQEKKKEFSQYKLLFFWVI